jgi:hypothetical protein
MECRTAGVENISKNQGTKTSKKIEAKQKKDNSLCTFMRPVITLAVLTCSRYPRIGFLMPVQYWEEGKPCP